MSYGGHKTQRTKALLWNVKQVGMVNDDRDSDYGVDAAADEDEEEDDDAGDNDDDDEGKGGHGRSL